MGDVSAASATAPNLQPAGRPEPSTERPSGSPDQLADGVVSAYLRHVETELGVLALLGQQLCAAAGEQARASLPLAAVCKHLEHAVELVRASLPLAAFCKHLEEAEDVVRDEVSMSLPESADDKEERTYLVAAGLPRLRAHPAVDCWPLGDVEMMAESIRNEGQKVPVVLAPRDAVSNVRLCAALAMTGRTRFVDVDGHKVPVDLAPESAERSLNFLGDALVLDGRTRLLALEQLGKEPVLMWDLGIPVEAAIIYNGSRRHMTESQRGLVAARLSNLSMANAIALPVDEADAD